MRKLLFIICICVLMPFLGRANPIVTYSVMPYISELSFDQNGKWYLELHVIVPPQVSLDSNLVDSLILTTSTQHGRIKNFPITQTDFYIVITQDSMYAPLNISSTQDDLELRLYGYMTTDMGWTMHDFAFQDDLSYGYAYSEIAVLNPGQSISEYGKFWCPHYKDNSPTMGIPNDTTDGTYLLKGILYDLNYNVIHSGIYKINPFIDSLHFFAADSFYVRMLSRRHFFNAITYNSSTLNADTFLMNAEPHGLFRHNIHLLSTLQNTDEVLSLGDQITVVSLPNPFRDIVTFYITIPEEFKFHEGSIQLFDAAGHEVSRQPLPRQDRIMQNMIVNNGSSAIYYYRLMLDGKVRKTGQIICSK